VVAARAVCDVADAEINVQRQTLQFRQIEHG
jgi:hypothetical protein